MVVNRAWAARRAIISDPPLSADGGESRVGGPEGHHLRFATFGTPLDVTLSELAIEAFYPADAATASLLKQTQDRLK